MDEMMQTLTAGLPALGLNLTEKQKKTLCDFGCAVIKQNEVMNLTAITEPVQVAKLHLLDSLTVLTSGDFAGKKLIDVGCGAGFPGVPLAIGCPELDPAGQPGQAGALAGRNSAPAGRESHLHHRPGRGSGGRPAGEL